MLEILQHCDPALQVVRTPGALTRGDRQRIGPGGGNDVVVDGLEQLESVDLVQPLLQRSGVDRAADRGVEPCGDDLVRDSRSVDDALRADDRQRGGRHARRARSPVGGVVVRGQGQPLEGGKRLPGGTLADGDGLARTLEGRHGDGAERWPDEHVAPGQRSDLPLRVLLRGQRGELGRDRGHGAELLATRRWRADVHGDDDVGAHPAHDIDREVVDDAAVHEQVTVDLPRRERARDGHAGAHRQGEVAVVEHHGLAGHDVRGDGAIRDAELVEVAHGHDRQGEPLEQEVDPVAVEDPRREEQRAAADSGFVPDQVQVVVALAAERTIGPRDVVREGLRPVRVGDDAVELGRGQARGV